MHAIATAVTIQFAVVWDFVVEVLFILIQFSVVDGDVVFDFGNFVHGWIPRTALTAQCEARLEL